MRSLFLFSVLVLVIIVFVGNLGEAAPDNAGSRSVELRVLGYDRWRAGGLASLRVIAYDARTAHGVGGVPIEIALRPPGKAQAVLSFKGTTNAQGTLEATLHVPQGVQGSATLSVAAPDLRGVQPLQAQVDIKREARIYLTTDKPLYQPGQTVHIRILALGEPALTPVANTPLVIEVEDSKANKIYKLQSATDRFGVASAAVELASEVNMGEYHVRCEMGASAGGSAVTGAVTAEKSITVKKYVLPKFKIAVKTEKAWYLPGEVVKGTVQADYFFGKSVAGAQVTIDAQAFDTGAHNLETLKGVTNESGTYAFELKLPDYMIGQPLEQGKATMGLAVRVQDASEHAETAGAQVSVVSQPIGVELFPESGHLVAGLPNHIYVLTAYPDGTPAPTTVQLNIGDFHTSTNTDRTGFGEVTYMPRREAATPSTQRAAANPLWRRRALAQNGWPDTAWTPPMRPLAATVVASDASGRRAATSISLSLAETPDALLVRPDKALYRVGDVFHAHLLSSKKSGDVYVDFIRDDQTILTQSVALQNGQADLSFPLAADTFGAITVHAYQIDPTSDVTRDTRKIFVQPARDLIVTVSADKSTYRPGDDSKLTFYVKDSQGAPQVAVLGVDIVDESLFALAERQPGLERVYFLLEREMMASRYEVHGLGLSDVVRRPDRADAPRRQELSRALFAQLPMPHPYTLCLDSFHERLQQMYLRMSRVQSAVYNYRARHGTVPTTVAEMVEDGLIADTDTLDAWGRRFGLRSRGGAFAIVYSVGPDGLAGTADDVDYYTLANEITPQDREGFARGGGAGGAVLHGMALPMARAVAAQSAPRGAVDDVSADTKDHAEARRDKVTERMPGTATRVRDFFPETLFTAPHIVTDGNGRATVSIPLADCITTWRLSAFASSLFGKMGNVTGTLRVFQEFFVDIDAPVSLTQNDIVSVPVSIFNYLPQAQSVHLHLDAADWYESLDGCERDVRLEKNQVSGLSFRIRALRPGTFPLTLRATGSRLSDAVRREISVMPDGREFVETRSDRLNEFYKTTVRIPADAVPHASKMLVTLYPGVFSQVVEGLDGILRMPGGCFEQTSSTTYPNVLVTGYLRKMRKSTPEIGMKAESFINTGYQRLLTFEVAGGGFSVFGRAPANPILTAYGLMEFADMAKVHEVDPNLLARTRAWLLAQQGQDGAWSAGRQGFYAEGWSNVPNSNLVATAYITWALLESGEQGKGVQRAVDYIRQHMKEAQDPYTAALTANALVAWNPRDAAALQAVDRLVAMRVDDADVTYWRTTIATAAYGTGRAGDIETTALAALAVLHSGAQPNVSNRALAYLVRSKDAYGTWQSTQATILAMKALLASVDKAAEKTNARVTVTVNGKKAGSFELTAEDFDVFKQVDVSGLVAAGANDVRLDMEGSGNAMFQISTHYWRPWKELALPPNDVLSIEVAYDRATLAKNDIATCSVRVSNLTHKVANQVMLDIGVPPGFDVQTEDLTALVKENTIAKFSVTGRQVIVYLDRLDAAQTLKLAYRIKARYPVRAQAPVSRAYEYYDPDRGAMQAPQLMVVQ